MKEIFSKTFGGLTSSYYFRNLFFGAIIFIVLFSILSNSKDEALSLGIGNLFFDNNYTVIPLFKVCL